MTEAVIEFAIFYDLGEGSEPWQITSVRRLEDAKAAMQQFAKKVPGRDFVWDSSKGEVIARFNNSIAV